MPNAYSRGQYSNTQHDRPNAWYAIKLKPTEKAPGTDGVFSGSIKMLCWVCDTLSVIFNKLYASSKNGTVAL